MNFECRLFYEVRFLNKMKQCQTSAEQSISSPQLYRHKLAVVQIVDAYLKRLCKSYGEQKAIRVKKVADMKRMSRLSQLLRDVGGFKRPNVAEKSEETVTNDSESTAQVRDTNKAEEQSVDEQVGSDCDQLAPELRAQLTKENDQLYVQFNTMVDEIQHLEGKVVEIARLQEVFTEKVLEQDGQIVHINETAIRTTENVKFGNEQIREAMKRGAGMRVYVLFFLLVLTFTLWFLDWYND